MILCHFAPRNSVSNVIDAGQAAEMMKKTTKTQPTACQDPIGRLGQAGGIFPFLLSAATIVKTMPPTIPKSKVIPPKFCNIFASAVLKID